jgi:hypothetical protein
MEGKIINDINYDKEKEVIVFTMDDGSKYKMLHYQDCCESVSIDWEKSASLDKLKGQKVISLTTNFEEHANNEYNSTTTTTYSFIMTDGRYQIVWEGSSNGYYGETPVLEKVEDDE